MAQAINLKDAQFKKAENQAEDLQILSSLYKACGDSLRLEILRVLKTGSYGVLELCDIFDMKQSGMSHHLKVLSTQHLVTTRREGNSIFYHRFLARDESFLHQNIRTLFQQIDGTPLSQTLETKIEDLNQQRADLGREFFNKNVAKFREQQELIAHYEQYAEGAHELLLAAGCPTFENVLELGPGDGRFLEKLSPMFGQVFAVDYSQEMLNQAKSFALEKNLDNIEFIHGDSKSFLETKKNVDAIVLNMVLHHLASPADCFIDLAKSLNEGGFLVLTDLCHHEQSWAKEACGDLWLGFHEEDLIDWATQAGLSLHQSSFLGLRNGFQISFYSFKK